MVTHRHTVFVPPASRSSFAFQQHRPPPTGGSVKMTPVPQGVRGADPNYLAPTATSFL